MLIVRSAALSHVVRRVERGAVVRYGARSALGGDSGGLAPVDLDAPALCKYTPMIAHHGHLLSCLLLTVSRPCPCFSRLCRRSSMDHTAPHVHSQLGTLLALGRLLRSPRLASSETPEPYPDGSWLMADAETPECLMDGGVLIARQQFRPLWCNSLDSRDDAGRPSVRAARGGRHKSVRRAGTHCLSCMATWCNCNWRELPRASTTNGSSQVKEL